MSKQTAVRLSDETYQRLAQFDAEHHAGETMAATPVGAERV